MLIPARRVSSIAVLCTLTFLATGTDAQHGAIPLAAAENFDIRTSKTLAASQFLEEARAVTASTRLAEMAGGQAAGLARLHSASQAEIEINPALGTPEIISARPGARFLTGPGLDRGAALRAFASSYADALGVTPADVQGLELVADYMNPAGNMGWAELQQRLNGIPVFQGYLRGGFTAKGELVRTTGPIAPGLDASSLPTTPSLQPSQAVALAAASVGWAVDESALALKRSEEDGRRMIFDRASMAGDAVAWLLYFPISPGTARLAWATQIVGDPDGFLTVVDAADGTILFRKNLTNYQTQSLTLNIYPSDSPAPSSPTMALPGANFQAPPAARQSFTLIGNEAPNTFNSLGWLTDGAITLTGNNVQSGLDLVAPDGIDTTVNSATRDFTAAYDPSTDAPSTVSYRIGEMANMFYWTNRHHDSLYLLGFTEQAGNFQDNNFGRGGTGGDRVLAEGQDYSSISNANFLTLPDGTPGRMQMFIFPGPAPDRSSGLDQDVILHELTHGTSNRLHANASGLVTTMSGGMGEGWSDFYARALLSDASENVNGVYAVGGWVTNLISAGYTDNYYYGIRRFPYAVRSNLGANGRPYNPLTFADIDPAQIDLTDGAHPRGPIGSAAAFQSHNIGEVWASALFEVRARFINRLGHAEGNRRILQYVTDGMKLDPVNPTFLQGRDSILVAATVGGDPLDIVDVWAGFAARGIGLSAQILNPLTGTVIEAFDVPGIAAAGGTLAAESAPNGGMDPGEFVTVSLCITNTAAVASGPVTASLQSSGGVTGPSIPQFFGVVAPAASVCRPFSFTVSTACGGAVTATLQAAEAGGATRSLAYSFPVGATTSFFGQNFDGVLAPSLPVGWSTSTLSGFVNLWTTTASGSDTPPNRAVVAEPNGVSDNILVSPTVNLPAAAVRLSFRNSYDMETNFDGGVLEISIGGGAFSDIILAGGSFVSGGYDRTISTSFSSPIGGRLAWSGNSGGYITTIVDLPAAASGQSVRLRWRMATDSSVADVGWSVDTISLGVLTCAATAPIAQPPQALSVDSVVGNTVRLRWTPPAGGLPATQYVVEGGVNPGQVLASIPTGNPAPVFTFAAPTGAFFVRVHTLSFANKSGPSNEVPLYVNVPVAPSPPANLLGTAAGSTLNLAWKNTFAGGAPTSMLLDVTGSLTATLPIGAGESFAFSGVPGGTYTVRLRAANAGGASAPSNAVALSFPAACTGVPAPPTNVLAYQVGARGFVIWDPPAGGPAPAGYVLNVSGTFTGSFPVAGRFVSAPIGPGTYHISVAGTNPCGTGAPAPTVVLSVP